MRIETFATWSMLAVGLLATVLGDYFSRLRKSLPDDVIVQEQRINPVRVRGSAFQEKAAPEPYRIPDAPPRSLAEQANAATVRLRFNDWFLRANLDRSKREKVATILEQHAETISRLGMVWTGDARKSGRQIAIDKLSNAVAPVLTAAEHRLFSEELASEEIRSAISHLGADLHRQGVPLTGEQWARLRATFKEFRPESEKNAPVLEMTAISWDAALENAASFLSPQQLLAVQALAARDNFNQRFRAIGGAPTRKLVPGL